MNSCIDQMRVEFHNTANSDFFSIYKAFEKAAGGLNRDKDEYRFQEIKKQYALLLEERLRSAANHILGKYASEKQSREIGQLFNQFIKEYLHRFVQKVNAI